MMNNQLGRPLAAGEPAIGVSNSFASPGIIELLCPGFDFVWIDAQHGDEAQTELGDEVERVDGVMAEQVEPRHADGDAGDDLADHARYAGGTGKPAGQQAGGDHDGQTEQCLGFDHR